MVPPPHIPTPPTAQNPKKRVKSNSPNIILFTIQRKTPKFPQNKKVHLVTLFLVHLRELPFSELGPKIPNPQKLSRSHPFDHHFSLFSPSLIKRTAP
jgi:hypothetical protein